MYHKSKFFLRRNLFDRILEVIMTISDKIRDEILQYFINREAAKISVLSLCKIGKFEYLTLEGVLPSDQSRMIEQAKFTYSLLGTHSEINKNDWKAWRQTI